MQEKNSSEKLIHLNEMEEHLLKQRSKIAWIRLGDGNNSFFHASLKSKQKQSTISSLQREDGSRANCQDEISREVLNFYDQLLGKSNEKIAGIDIGVIRTGK